MGYLGIDVEQARALIESLRVGAEWGDQAHELMTSAATMADLPMPCVLELDALNVDLALIANLIDRAIVVLTRFEIRLDHLTTQSMTPEPIRTPVPGVTSASVALPNGTQSHALPVQWDAGLDSAWVDVHQAASHNSYAVVGGVDVLFDHGVRAFELDIHHEPPGHERIAGADAVSGWHVYHVLGWSHREYRSLTQGLAAVAALDSREPITLFVDNKDDFGGSHSARAFDDALHQAFGDRLYRPGDFLARSPEALSLVDAAEQSGWPTVRELEGRVLVVLTDNVGGYPERDQLAFVAPPPSFTLIAGQIAHEPDPGAVFYNADARRISTAEVQALHATNTVLRTYFNPLCPERFVDEEPVEINYRAVDVAIDGSACEPKVIVGPTPVPDPDSLHH